jgi:hypothetical protein
MEGPGKGSASQVPPVILSNDPTVNPRFHDVNHVWIPYCTGDNWLGQLTEDNPAHAMIAAGVCKTPMCLFQGHINLLKILPEIFQLPGFGVAEKVLFQGVSAGGHGVILHCDMFADLVADAAPQAATKCNAISGLWLPNMAQGDQQGTTEYYALPLHSQVFSTPGSDTWPFETKNGAVMAQIDQMITNFAVYLPPTCVEKLQEKNVPSNLCFSAGTAYSFLKTPVFLTQNLFDVNMMILSFIGMDWGMASQTNLMENREWYSYWGTATRRSVTEQAKEADGYFLPACLDHVSGIGAGGSGGPMARTHNDGVYWGPLFDQPAAIKIDGTTGHDAMADWFFRHTSDMNYDQHVDSCLDPIGCKQVACNPTCWNDGDWVTHGDDSPDACSQSGLDMTCGKVRDLYKEQECCGNPERPFTVDRRLGSSLVGTGEPLLSQITKALDGTKDASRRAALKQRILAEVKRFM